MGLLGANKGLSFPYYFIINFICHSIHINFNVILQGDGDVGVAEIPLQFDWIDAAVCENGAAAFAELV